MRPPWVLAAVAALVAGCAPADGSTRPAATYVQVNLAGGWADGAERDGADGVTIAVVDLVRDAGATVVFLNEACESHAAHAAARLGPAWRAFFVRTWDGHSDCFPAPGAGSGRFGNAVLVHDVDGSARPVTIPSCNDLGADRRRCLPNWAAPAEQRRVACAADEGVLLCAAHLDPRHWAPHDAQLRALGEVAGELVGVHELVVVGGDLNDGPDAVGDAFGDAFVSLAGDMAPATYPAVRPQRSIDHVLAGGRGASPGGMRTVDLGWCEQTHRDDGRCTDHLAVVAARGAG